jgi:monoamine oxidase
MDCAQDEDYVDVFEFMAQQQSAALRPSQFSIDKSSATLSLIEQQRLSASIATPLPPACGTHAEASAGTHEAAAIQAAQSINANFRPGNDARTEMKSISKDPLSMRMDMETEMMATTVDSDQEESASSSQVGAAGCMSWVKTPARVRRSELQRGLSHTNRPSESVLFRNPDNSWFGGILGGRVTSTSSSKQLSASPSTRVSANSASDTNPYSTEPLSNYESTLKVMRLLCERACVRTCAGST